MIRPVCILLLVLSIFSQNADAAGGEAHPLFRDDWLVRLGANRADTNAKLGLSNDKTGTIPILDLNTLGIDTVNTSVYANLIWQKPERWNWSLTYFESKAEGRRTIDRDLTFGNLEIPAGLGVGSDFKTQFFILNGAYDILDRTDQVAGVGFGLYSLNLKASVGLVNDGQFIGEVETTDTLAPLPTFSLYYRRAFNDKWALLADAGYFSANYEKYDGEIMTARLTVDYWVNEHWGIGLGYSLVDVDLDVDEDIFDERYDVNWDSFFLYLTFGF